MSENPAAESSSSVPEVSMEQLGDLRAKTDAVSQSLHGHLTAFVQTLRPLLAPSSILGEHVRGGTRDDADHADQVFDDLKQRFTACAGKPFSLPKELKIDPISVEGRLELYPYEYSHTLSDPAGDKVVTMTCPLRWILVYRSGYNPSELRKLMISGENRRAEDVRQFLTSAITLDMMLDKRPDIVSLLSELRYELEVGTIPGFGELPMVTVNACLPSFRPSDSLIRTATQFSGVSAFIELIDLEAIERINDPMKRRIEAII
ncbi:MAG: hypothetical protein ACI8W3_001520 [Myxococcota bacterium]|jgi:hypothetical protein